jgi:HEAT repeat protein
MRSAVQVRWLALVGLSVLVGVAAADESPNATRIEQLIKQLGSPEFEEREAANKALEAIGPPALDALDAAVSNADPEIRRRVFALLDSIETRHYGRPVTWDGKRLPQWRELLTNKDPEERLAAVRALGHLAPAAGRIVPVLLPVLKDQDSEVQLEAIRTFARFGAAGRPALDALKEALRDPSKPTQAAAAEALWRVDARADLAVPVLAELLSEKDAPLRLEVAAVLGRMAPYAREAVPALTRALRQANRPDRLKIAAVLWEVDRRNDAASSLFLEEVQDGSDLALRRQALRYLQRWGNNPERVVPVFLKLLQDQDGRVHSDAARGLRGIAPNTPAVFAALLEALDDPVPWTRASAALALGSLDDASPDVSRALAKALTTDKDSQVRLAALRALAGLGPRTDAFPALLEATRDPHIRRNALCLVGRLGREAREAVPALLAMLKDKDLRGEAARTLGQIGPDAAAAIPALIDILNDGYTNKQTIAALVAIGPAAIEPLIGALNHKDAQISMQSAQTLGRMGVKAVAPLRKVLATGNKKERWQAVHALSLIGFDPADVEQAKQARAAIPDLIPALAAEDGALRRSAARAVCALDPESKEVFPVLLGLVEDRDLDVRATVWKALGELGPKAKKAVPSLTPAAERGPLWFRMIAAEVIWRIDPEAARPIPLLLEALKDTQPLVRWRAIEALERMGQAAEPALDAVAAGLEDKDPFVRQAAYRVLLGRCPHLKELSPAVAQACGLALEKGGFTPVQDSRVTTAQMLGRIGPRAKAAVPALQKALRSRFSQVQVHAALALWKIERSPDAVPVLIERLANHNSTGRTDAAECLAEIGPDARAAIPTLVLACQSTGASDTGDLRVRPAAALALLKIDPRTQPWVIPVLIESLQDGLYLEARQMAARTLGEIGPDARAAVPELRRAVHDFDEALQPVAVEALRKIERKAMERVP